MAQIVTGQQEASSDKLATPDEATDQLREPVEDRVTTNADAGEIKTPATSRSGRHLIIRVSEGGESKANIHIPLGLARAGIKFIPLKEKENLKAQGIDVEELLTELTGDEQGELVQVEEDGKTVWIGVE